MGKDRAAVALGKRGGAATLARHGVEHFRRMAELSPKTGRKLKPNAKPESIKRRKKRACRTNGLQNGHFTI